MVSITVTLHNDDLARLKAVAAALGRTPEDVARAGIESLLYHRGAAPGNLRDAADVEVADGRGRRITELEGLGRDVWRGIDAQDYVRHERDAWTG
jgi:site-specific recombinase XerC